LHLKRTCLPDLPEAAFIEHLPKFFRLEQMLLQFLFLPPDEVFEFIQIG